MRLWTKAALLTLIPLIIMTAIGVTLFSQGSADDGRSTIAVGVILGATMGASVIYQVEQWPLRKQSLTHLGVMAGTVLPALLLSGWFPLDTPGGLFPSRRPVLVDRGDLMAYFLLDL
jgi:xanthine/uracil permease